MNREIGIMLMMMVNMITRLRKRGRIQRQACAEVMVILKIIMVILMINDDSYGYDDDDDL